MINFLRNQLGHRNFLRIGWHKCKSFIAAARYGFPAKNLVVIGITGTDGKTTTVGMVNHIFKKTGIQTITASTAFVVTPNSTQANRSHKTSMSPFALQKLLRQGYKEGATHAVIEVSSHGLVQGRLNYLWPTVAAITNISPESLDYHGSFEQYQADKGILFTMLKGVGTKIINIACKDCSLYESYSSETTYTFGTSVASMDCTNLHGGNSTTSGTIHYGGTTKVLQLPIPGLYNLENAQCAILCAITQGIPLQDAVDALSTFNGIPGRLQKVEAGQNFTVFVDFTVTSGAYEQTLSGLRAIKDKESKLLVLCSSCGDRMKEKRPIIAGICSQYADVVVVTEDETYGEDPVKVLNEVWQGIDHTQCTALKINDRREAIHTIISLAQPNDIVILCGMGPFDSFKTLTGDIPWNEAEIAKEAIQKTIHNEQ